MRDAKRASSDTPPVNDTSTDSRSVTRDVYWKETRQRKFVVFFAAAAELPPTAPNSTLRLGAVLAPGSAESPIGGKYTRTLPTAFHSSILVLDSRDSAYPPPPPAATA